MGELAPPEEVLAEFREEIRLLALPAADQERWLAQHKFPVDELALQFDDSFRTLWRLTEAGLVDASAREAITALSDFLGSFSGHQNAPLWTEEALYAEQVWEHVRELARTALERLGKAQAARSEAPREPPKAGQ